MQLNLGFPPTPEYAAQHAEQMIQPAKEISGVDLDFKPESLAGIDGIIEDIRSEGVSAEEVGGTLFGFGCYLGEVLVRNHGAAWKLTDDTPMKGMAGFPMVVELEGESVCNPIGKTFKRFENGEEDSLASFYQVFTQPQDPRD